MTTAKNKPTIKLTPRGEMVAKKAREEREENIRRNNGEYIPDPWYKRYLSKDFVIPEHKPANVAETDKEAYELLEGLTRSKSNRKRHQAENEDVFEEDKEENIDFSDTDENYEEDEE